MTLLLAALLCVLAPAQASSPVEDAQRAELERVRGEIADQVQLSAYDLVDELVLTLVQHPVFEKPTPVVVAGVTVPVGLGTGLEALIENHLAAVVGENPTSNLSLVHCPACTAVVVHSAADATVISRGIDDPAVLEQLGAASGRHALFVDIEAEGTWLVLRARITRLTPELPIVWSHTIASAASTPALLRAPDDLKTASDARQDYLAALRDRGPLSVPLRFAIRTYAEPNGDSGTPPPPFLWLQSGVEMGANESRAWTASLLAGYSFIPQAYQGLMAQARVSRLVTGRARSYSRPDLYLFVGGAVVTVWGPATASFTNETLTLDQIVASLEGDDPRNSFGALHFGVDLRLGNRIGVSTFLETLPSLTNSPNLGSYLNVLVEFHSFGTEATFWF